VAAPSTQSSSAAEIADLVRASHDRQLETLNSLDQKAATLLGFAGVVLGLIFNSSVAIENWNAGLTTGAAATALAILLLAGAIMPRRYATNPNPIALAAHYMDRAPDETHRAVVESINRAIRINTNRQRPKLVALRLGAFLLLVGC